MTRRHLLRLGLLGLLARPPTVGHARQPVQDSLLHGCQLWLLMLPGRQGNTSVWRSLAGSVHGTPTNFLPTTSATRGLAAQTTRRGGYGEMRLPGTNTSTEGGIFFPVDQLQFLEGLTMAFWVNLQTVPDGASHRFLVAGATTATRAYGVNNVASDSRLNFIWSANNRLTMTGSLGTQTWHHVVGTRTGTLATSMIAQWYIDGALDSASSAITADPTANAGDYTTIGCRSDGTLLPHALMDDIMLYDRSLDALEVRALYQDSILGHPRLLSTVPPALLYVAGGSRVKIRLQWQ